MHPIEINVENPTFYYSIFYLSAFLVSFILLTVEGIRRKFPLVTWWMVVATAFLFFMIGTQVIKLGASDWASILRLEPLSTWPGRGVLGGILLSIPATLLAKRLLKFNYRIVDALAFTLPLGLVVQRVGCLLGGCCFGTPTALPWGIQYSNHSPVFEQQIGTHLIPQSANSPMPVHPAQLYDLLCCVVVLVILYKVRARLKAPGNLVHMSFVLYGIFRFFIEFYRAQYEPLLFSLNIIQLSLLVIIPVAVLVMVWMERHVSPDQPSETDSGLAPHAPMAFIVGLVILFALLSRWMSGLEVLAMNIVLVPILGGIAWQTFQRLTLPSFRLATLSMLIVALVLMGQTFPEYSQYDSTRLSYLEVAVGTISGTSSTNYSGSSGYYGSSAGGCGSGSGGPIYSHSETYHNAYDAKAAGLSYVQQYNKQQSLVLSMSGFWGNHEQTFVGTATGHPTIQRAETFSTFGISPFAQYNWESIGIGGGFTTGNFAQLLHVTGYDPTSVDKLSFAPSFNFRAGSLRSLFIEYRYGNQFPAAFPSLASQLSMGIGIGKRGGAIRVGTSSFSGIFIAPSFTMGEHVVLEGYFGTGAGLGSKSAGAETNNVSSFSLRYKLNRNYKSPLARRKRK